MSVLVVTGTGTDVGKTIVTAALAATLGPGVAVVKPAQTGVGPDEPGDLAEVTRLAGVTDTHEFVRYPDPLSPHAAARVSGRPPLELAVAADAVRRLAETHEHVLVEGAGGLLVEFAPGGWTLRDLAAELRAPVLVVVTAELGTLNVTALTLEALRGHEVAGLVIGSWPAAPGLVHRTNVVDLAAVGPLVGAVPAGVAHRTDFATAAHDWLAPSLNGRFDAAAFVRNEGDL